MCVLGTTRATGKQHGPAQSPNQDNTNSCYRLRIHGYKQPFPNMKASAIVSPWVWPVPVGHLPPRLVLYMLSTSISLDLLGLGMPRQAWSHGTEQSYPNQPRRIPRASAPQCRLTKGGVSDAQRRPCGSQLVEMVENQHSGQLEF